MTDQDKINAISGALLISADVNAELLEVLQEIQTGLNNWWTDTSAYTELQEYFKRDMADIRRSVNLAITRATDNAAS